MALGRPHLRLVTAVPSGGSGATPPLLPKWPPHPTLPLIGLDTVWRWCTTTKPCPNGVQGAAATRPGLILAPPQCAGYDAATVFEETSQTPPNGTIGAFLATSTTDGDTFVVGGDGAVYRNFFTHPEQTPEVSGWLPLGRPAAGIYHGVKGATHPPGVVDLFVRGMDGQAYRKTPVPAAMWQRMPHQPLPTVPWIAMGAPTSGIAYDIEVSTNAACEPDVFVMGGDGRVHHRYVTPGQGDGWSAWISLGAPTTLQGDVQVSLDAQCTQVVFVTGTDGIVYRNFATPGVGNGWSGWTSLGGPPGGFDTGVRASYNWQHAQVLTGIGNDRNVWVNRASLHAPGTWEGWVCIGRPQEDITHSLFMVASFGGTAIHVMTAQGEYWCHDDQDTPTHFSAWAKA